jgi:hypothetical protein
MDIRLISDADLDGFIRFTGFKTGNGMKGFLYPFGWIFCQNGLDFCQCIGDHITANVHANKRPTGLAGCGLNLCHLFGDIICEVRFEQQHWIAGLHWRRSICQMVPSRLVCFSRKRLIPIWQ